MIHNQPVLLQSLVHLAWCDGQLQEQELQFLNDLFLELGVEHFLKERWLSEQPPLPKDSDLIVACPDPGARREFLKVAVKLAWVDGELCDPEWLLIKHLCQTLGIRKHTWSDLQSWLGV